MSKRNNILIIDDDPRNILALAATLRAKGFSNVSASSAEEGIAVLRKHSGIGIVLLDMMMPEMDGYEALPLLKAVRPNESLPIIAVTAQAMVGDRERCMNAGASDYISKPIDVDDLLSKLKFYLE